MLSERLFSQPSGIETWSLGHTAAAIVITIYVLIVRGLRYRRMVDIQRPFTIEGRSLSSMTNTESHSILEQLQRFEFPRAFMKARQLAQLKVSVITFHSPTNCREIQPMHP